MKPPTIDEEMREALGFDQPIEDDRVASALDALADDLEFVANGWRVQEHSNAAKLESFMLRTVARVRALASFAAETKRAEAKANNAKAVQ